MEHNSEAGGDRRRYDRYDFRLPIVATYEKEGMKFIERSSSVNISAGGACFPCSRGFEPGAHLIFRIGAPSSSLAQLFGGGSDKDASAPVWIRTQCEVVRSEARADDPNEFLVGVQFSSPLCISSMSEGENE